MTRTLNEAEKSLLINFIVTCFQLTPEEETDFQRLLEQEDYQEVREMRETYFDKLERRGMRKILTRQLQAKFGPLPQEVADRVNKIESEDELQKIAEKVVTASSLAELGLDKV
ncbi:MAG: DUF4351 domain-containing protein [Candidatus Poribacteria bacterium]